MNASSVAKVLTLLFDKECVLCIEVNINVSFCVSHFFPANKIHQPGFFLLNI